MSDVFTRLVDRALDRAPRARPRLAPRFGRPSAGLPIEEPDAKVEAPAVEATSTPPRSAPVREERPALEVPREVRGVATPGGRTAAGAPEPPIERVPRIEREVGPEARPAASSFEHNMEQVVHSVVERTRLVEAGPLAAPATPLRSADAAALRPTEGRTTAPTMGERRVASRQEAIARDSRDATSDAIQVSIGRIDVRAVGAAPAAAAPPKPRVAPMGLDEYLRRRSEGR
ncbi:MAG TPA: hypothetical protein VIF09_03960 [Polyangiaceae bacterium]|jgi:hypothetical protein